LRLQNRAKDRTIVELETELRNGKSAHDAERLRRDEEFKCMKATIDSQLCQYCALLDVKIRLDSQIAAYHKLLDTGEKRYIGL